MPQPWKLSGKDKKKLHTLYARGRTDEEIAEALGVTLATIYYWRNKEGLPSNTSKIEPISREEIAKRLLKDWKCCPIAEDLGVPLQVVNAVSDELFAAGMLS